MYRRAIYISRNIEPDQLIPTLRHEMCHIGSKTHGAIWRQKMIRLGDRGAPVAGDGSAAAGTVGRCGEHHERDHY